MGNQLVTIGVPVSKGAWLTEALECWRRQTYANIEVVIVNDASKDDIDSVVTPYLSDRRFSYHKNRSCSFPNFVRNWNKCLSYANGEFFVLLCDDDIMLPNFIATMFRLAKQNPHCNVFKTRTTLIDSKTNITIGQSPRFPQYETFIDFLSNTM